MGPGVDTMGTRAGRGRVGGVRLERAGAAQSLMARSRNAKVLPKNLHVELGKGWSVCNEVSPTHQGFWLISSAMPERVG